MYFWIDTQMQNTQIGVDTSIQIYNDIERFRAVEITIYDCRYSATAGFVGFGCENVKISGSHLRGGLPAAHLRRRPGGLEMWPVEKIFCCQVSSRRFIGACRVSPGVFLPKALPGATKRSRRQVADCDSVTGESLCLLKSMTSWQVLEQILKDTKKERNDMKWYEMIRQILRNATRKWNEKSKLQLKSQRWPRRDWQVIICNNVDDVLMMSAGARSYPRYTCLIHLFPPERLQEWHECSHHCTWLSCRNRQTDAEKTSNSNQ